MALEDLTHLVIDEADRMVQPGHFEVRLLDRGDPCTLTQFVTPVPLLSL